MGFGLAFWILMLIWFVFGLWGNFTPQGAAWWAPGSAVLLFCLLLLLGWHAFGPPIHG